MPDIINHGEAHAELSDETKNLIKEKLWSSWGSARDQFDVPNLHRTAEILYQALYEPDQIDSTEIKDNPAFNRLEYLSMPISMKAKPEKEEFILAIRQAMTKEADFEKTLYPNAKELLKTISAIGPVTIWSRGDVSGIKDTQYQGSHEQIKKIAYSGLNELRKEVAKERGLEDYHSVFSVEAGEDKLDKIQKIVKQYELLGVEKIVLLDDILTNLTKADKIIQTNSDMELYPIWVRQGIKKNQIPKDSHKTLEEWEEELHAINSIGEINSQLEQGDLLKEGVGFIIDYDNVLSDDETRKEVQLEAVLNKLQEKGWI